MHHAVFCAAALSHGILGYIYDYITVLRWEAASFQKKTKKQKEMQEKSHALIRLNRYKEVREAIN